MELHLPEVNIKMLYREHYISTNYPEFYLGLMSLYEDSPNYNEKLYRYLHNIEIKPICPICGQPIPYRNSPAGYGKFCSTKCMGKSEERKKLIRNTKLEKYGDSNYNNPKKASYTMNERYGGRGLSSHELRKKCEQTCIEKFGVDNVFKLKEFQDKGCKTKLNKYGNPHYTNYEKYKQTCIDRYGCDNPMKDKNIHKKFTDTMLSKYGVKYAMLNKNFVNKLSGSLVDAHKNGKYDMSGKEKTPSKIEKQFKQYLDENNIKYVFQHRSEKYPYLCDFYICDYDLYIEIQGCWTHGKHPYNPHDEDDIKLINTWKNKNSKFYNQAIYVWSILDVEKRQIAKDNNINYLEIFNIKIDECIKLFENKIKEICGN